MSLIALAATFVALLPVLTLSAVPLAKQPFPDSPTYADAAWELAHAGAYRTHVNQGVTSSARYLARPVPPRYPFGTSAMLAPFVLIFGHAHGAQIGARVIVAAYVVAMVAAGLLLGGPVAATLTALFIRISPFTDTMATLVLSDPLAALLTVLVLIALIRRARTSFVLTGALLGALIDVRLLGIVALPAAFLVAGRRRWLVLAGVFPFVALLAYYQWHAFGSPFKTGYSYWLPGLKQFGLTYVTGQPYGRGASLVHPHASALFSSLCNCNPTTQMSNLAFYPSVLSGLLWVYAPPLTGLIGLAALIRWRRTPQAQYALMVIVFNVAVLFVYFWQASRFVAPAASLLLIYAAVGITAFATWALEHAPAAHKLFANA